jgi:L-ascorbate metabolism protein UlaG (beta-lactamase superfamily)
VTSEEAELNSRRYFQGLVTLFFAATCAHAWAQNVKITPLGTHDGELCDRDRAMILEDPTGVRILYDSGHSVMGGNDPRLGTVHVVLLTHAHGDHIGDRRITALNQGTCDKPETVAAAPNGTTAEIAAAKNSSLIMIRNMAFFVGKKIENIRGKPVGNCAEPGGSIAAVQSAPCLAAVELGGSKTVKAANAASGVEITTVYAAHDSTVSRDLLTDGQKKIIEPDNLGVSLGTASGYIVKFTNGLRVYLSGDTGLHSEMRTVVREFHHANLAVINLGQNAIQPDAAAFAINELVRPAAVIVSHPNEGVTSGGVTRAGTRTKAFIEQVKGRPVYLAISGRVLEFDGSGTCMAGGCYWVDR